MFDRLRERSGVVRFEVTGECVVHAAARPTQGRVQRLGGCIAGVPTGNVRLIVRYRAYVYVALQAHFAHGRGLNGATA